MPAPAIAAEPDLDLLRGLTPTRSSRYWLAILASSVLLHLLFFSVAIRLPAFSNAPPVRAEPQRKVTHLYLPPDVLTQRAPNRREVTRNIDLASLMATPDTTGRAARAARPRVRHFEAPPTAPVPKPAARTPVLPDFPAPAVPPVQSASIPPGIANPLTTAAPPPPKPAPSPFQDVGSDAPLNPNPTLHPPKADLQSAIQGLAQSNNGQHMVITDDAAPTRQLPGTLGSGSTGNGPHAAVELQSDPQGADFRAYLTQVLTVVRGNWRRVIPESVRLGVLRGRTTVEFSISRDGKIPKMVIASTSGSQALDRAAAAGLSMSDPLPPLPANFRGMQVRLAFTFTYNMQSPQ